MIVVSNASPLINLARIGQIGLLRELYGELWIPEAVRREVVEEGTGQAGADEVGQADWIITQVVSNQLLVQALRQELDAGEAEAIVLAAERNADLLLMDERLGREVAQHLGVAPTGLIGVLVEAKGKGAIPAIRPCLSSLRDRAGFRLSEALVEQILDDAGESE